LVRKRKGSFQGQGTNCFTREGNTIFPNRPGKKKKSSVFPLGGKGKKKGPETRKGNLKRKGKKTHAPALPVSLRKESKFVPGKKREENLTLALPLCLGKRVLP